VFLSVTPQELNHVSSVVKLTCFDLYPVLKAVNKVLQEVTNRKDLMFLPRTQELLNLKHQGV
jgi:hypothetical protein